MKDFTPGKTIKMTILKGKRKTIQSLHSVNFKNNNDPTKKHGLTKLMPSFKQNINKKTKWIIN